MVKDDPRAMQVAARMLAALARKSPPKALENEQADKKI